MTTFETVKTAVDIKAAAELYGLHFDRHNRAICPFHSDKHASLSVDPRRGVFCCFACGQRGDVIKLTQRLTGAIRPLDACRRLNYDFGLNILDLEDKPLSVEERRRVSAEAKEREKKEKLKRRFSELRKKYTEVCCEYHRLLHRWTIDYAPNNADEESRPHPLFVFATQNISRADAVSDFLIYGEDAEIWRFFQNPDNQTEVINIAYFVQAYNSEFEYC